MKSIFTYLFTIIPAALVFYGGAGVNVISYCCNQCRSAGIEILREDKCCEIHNYHRPGNSCYNYASQITDATCGNSGREHECHHAAGNVRHDDCRNRSGHSGYDSSHNNNCQANDHCNMERIHFDWYSHFSPESNVKFSPVALDLLPCESVDVSFISPLTCDAGWGICKGPPVVRPRDYLSGLTLLLI
ncbi:MAG: hypothetical protein LBC47_10700 [Tannerella sp.]|nr:hypothetical protein [Tannerella sp.]